MKISAKADDRDELKVARRHCADDAGCGAVEHVSWIHEGDQDRCVEKITRHGSAEILAERICLGPGQTGERGSNPIAGELFASADQDFAK
jgi:hypothetical protein